LDLGDTSINRSSEVVDLESSGQPDMMTPDEAEQLLSTKYVYTNLFCMILTNTLD
jgi:hypothetical protein